MDKDTNNFYKLYHNIILNQCRTFPLTGSDYENALGFTF